MFMAREAGVMALCRRRSKAERIWESILIGNPAAVQAWEDYAARDKGPDSDAAHERDIDEYLKPEIADLNWDDFDADESGSDVCKLLSSRM